MSDSLETKPPIDEKSEETNTNGKEENLSKHIENETNIQKKERRNTWSPSSNKNTNVALNLKMCNLRKMINRKSNQM